MLMHLCLSLLLLPSCYLVTPLCHEIKVNVEQKSPASTFYSENKNRDETHSLGNVCGFGSFLNLPTAFCYQPPRLGISSDLAPDDGDSNGTAQHSALLAKVY